MRRALFAGAVAVATALATAGVASPAAADHFPDVGAETLTLEVGDDTGGSYEMTFDRAYVGATPDGTPIYIYAPLGWEDGAAGVFGLDPNIDPNPGNEFVPCGGDASAYDLDPTLIEELGDELASHIVRIDEEHFGEIGDADGTHGDNDNALVTLIYNVFDNAYYDCAAGSYTAGYFAPQFIEDYGMNTIVLDANEFDEMTGDPENATDLTNEGVIAHELEHLLHHYGDKGELSWVDEGLADFAMFLNGYPTGGSHITYHQVFHRETSLTRWAGGLENYGASYTFFQYLWERAGGNGGSGEGQFAPDLEYDDTAGDRLIQLIFANQADGMAGVQAAIDEYNATNDGDADLPTAKELFKDWSIAVYLDDESSDRYDIKAIEMGGVDSQGWTIDIANDEFWKHRGQYTGATPEGRFAHSPKVPAQTALPFGTSYETFTNPGKTFRLDFSGVPSTQIEPHSEPTHWYGGATSQSDNVLDVEVPVTGGDTVDFWTWYFIEEGWDFGFMEALVHGQWVTVPLTDVDTGQVATTNEDPHGNNEEGNGLTGTSGGTYFVDEPEYVHLQGVLPADATDVRFRYSTDAAYLDTGWFIDDVSVNGVAVTDEGLFSDTWNEVAGVQENDWSLQVIAPCDLTPDVSGDEYDIDNGRYIYRYSGAEISQDFVQCSTKATYTVVISNLPSGDLDTLDADYTFRATRTANNGQKN